GHFAKNGVLRQGLEDTIAEANFDIAALNDEQFPCRVAFLKDDIASLEVQRLNAGGCEKSKIDRRTRHLGALSFRCRAVAPCLEDKFYLLSPGWRWIGSTHSTVFGFSTGSISRLIAIASPSLRTNTHSRISSGLALIS